MAAFVRDRCTTGIGLSIGVYKCSPQAPGNITTGLWFGHRGPAGTATAGDWRQLRLDAREDARVDIDAAANCSPTTR